MKQEQIKKISEKFEAMYKSGELTGGNSPLLINSLQMGTNIETTESDVVGRSAEGQKEYDVWSNVLLSAEEPNPANIFVTRLAVNDNIYTVPYLDVLETGHDDFSISLTETGGFEEFEEIISIEVENRNTSVTIANARDYVYMLSAKFIPMGEMVTYWEGAPYYSGLKDGYLYFTAGTIDLDAICADYNIARDSLTKVDVKFTALVAGFTEPYFTTTVNYRNGTNANQTMDIHVPTNLTGSATAPAVITLHGGGWSTPIGGDDYYCDKSYYDYMTDFITQDCGCVHVNMNYRLLGTDGGLDTGVEAKLPYEQMLEDIQSVIGYLQTNSSVYHVDTTKIALMGYSAGAHLALLYAYKNPTQIDLVISEAGPTDLTTDWVDLQSVVEAVVGDFQNNKSDASPISHISSNVPFTILAYGNGKESDYHHYDDYDGDGLIPYSQVTALQNIFEGLNNSSQYYKLYTFNEVAHEQFGNGENTTYPYTICPDSTEEAVQKYYSCEEEHNPGLKQLINTHLFSNN